MNMTGGGPDDLGFDAVVATAWFAHQQEVPYVLVNVRATDVAAWEATLGIALRRCYVTDDVLETQQQVTGVPLATLVEAKLPDPGSTMAGDFGEFVAYLYQAVKAQPAIAIGAKKWRLKQDRTKPAPYSDVLHFVLPQWPQASTQDVLLCSEVKTKSTASKFSPITAAIEDCEKDRTSRLSKTLVWLKERALFEDLGDVSIAHLDRFIKATDHPPARKEFRAVAVVCTSLVQGELRSAPPTSSADYTLVVISVPNLHAAYSALFAEARRSLPNGPRPGGNR
jgi:hypothetical protein